MSSVVGEALWLFGGILALSISAAFVIVGGFWWLTRHMENGGEE